MSELKNQIIADMKSAMKAKDSATLKAVRMIVEAIKQKEVDTREDLDDQGILAVIQKMVKQRKDSIDQFTQAGRGDLVAVEEAELKVINLYMPKQLSESEIESVVDQVISQTGASGMQDIGQLMGVLKGELSGKADMGTVSNIIKSKLS
ncbi:MAG: GatB/YqeY domain-containing protein [Gammaproteobacteria bacterium]|jgi:uncharacterized protein YqeY|nr:GatB/YqeY domain-containing protein [Gammaproteobacteria bacterium]